MAKEARLILRDVVAHKPNSRNLTTIIRSHFWPAKGAPHVDLECRRATLGTSRHPSAEPAAMTVLLDKNVVSELMRKGPDPTVAVWAAGHRLENLFFSALGEVELRYGAAILPIGQRPETLVSDIKRMLDEAFENRMLPFDSVAARAYADIAAMGRSTGRPVAPADCQIAAIAPLPRRMAVATSNVRNLEDVRVDVVDPWATA